MMAESASAKVSLHSSDEYSSDDDINPKSLFNIHKAGHIPGQYKKEKQSAVDADKLGETQSKMDAEKSGENTNKSGENTNKSEESTNMSEENTNKFEVNPNRVSSILQSGIFEKSAAGSGTFIKSMSDSGIFGKSMIVIPPPGDDSTDGSRKKPPPPVPAKPKVSDKSLSSLSSQLGDGIPRPSPRGAAVPTAKPRPVPRQRTKRLSLPDMEKTVPNVREDIKGKQDDAKNLASPENVLVELVAENKTKENVRNEGVKVLSDYNYGVSDSLLPDAAETAPDTVSDSMVTLTYTTDTKKDDKEVTSPETTTETEYTVSDSIVVLTDTTETKKDVKEVTSPENVVVDIVPENELGDDGRKGVELLRDYDCAVSDSLLIKTVPENKLDKGDMKKESRDGEDGANDEDVTEQSEKVEELASPRNVVVDIVSEDNLGAGDNQGVIIMQDYDCSVSDSLLPDTDDKNERLVPDSRSEVEPGQATGRSTWLNVTESKVNDSVNVEEDTESNDRADIGTSELSEVIKDVADKIETLKLDVTEGGVDIATTEGKYVVDVATIEAEEVDDITSTEVEGRVDLANTKVEGDTDVDTTEVENDADVTTNKPVESITSETTAEAHSNREDDGKEIVATLTGADIDDSETSDSNESFKSVDDIVSDEEDIFLDSEETDKHQDEPDSAEQLSSNNERDAEVRLDDSTSSSGMESIVIIPEHVGYTSMDSTVTSGERSSSASFIILSREDTSEPEPDSINESIGISEKDDSVEQQHMDTDNEGNHTTSPAQSTEISIKESEECPLSQESTDSHGNKAKDENVVESDCNEPKHTDSHVDSILTASTTESIERAARGDNDESAAKGGNETDHTEEEAGPPPIMPKSETVLESLKSMQIGMEASNIDRTSKPMAEGVTKPSVVAPNNLPLKQGERPQSWQSTGTNATPSAQQARQETGSANINQEQTSLTEENKFDSLPKVQAEYSPSDPGGANYPSPHYYNLPPNRGYPTGFGTLPHQQGTPTRPPFYPNQPYMRIDQYGRQVPMYPPMQHNTGTGFYHNLQGQQQQPHQPYMPYPGGYMQPPTMQQPNVQQPTEPNPPGNVNEPRRHTDVRQTPGRSHSPYSMPTQDATRNKTAKSETDTPSLNTTSTTKAPSSQPKPTKRQTKPSKPEKKTVDTESKETPKPSRTQRTLPRRTTSKTKANEEQKGFCIQFKGRIPGITPDTLTNIIEIATGLETDSDKVIINQAKESAWVILDTKPDLEKLKERIKRKGMNGSYPVVSEVPVSSVLQKTERKPVAAHRESMKHEKKASISEKKEKVAEHQESFIFFKGINPETKEENIRNFVETATRGSIDEIIFNYTTTCSVVHVEGDSKPDLDKLRSKIEKNGLEGYKPDLTMTPLPTSIVVSSLSPIHSLESLGLYFESRRSFGDKILQDPYESEDGICYIVEYESYEVVQRVCKKLDHQVDKVALRVSPYHKCDLGFIWDAKLHTVVLPEPVSIEVDKLTTQFLQKDCCATLWTQLEDKYCKVTFTDKGVQLECLITPKVEGFKQLALDWEKTSENVVHKYIDDTIKKEKVLSDDAAWYDLMEFFQTEMFETRDGILTAPCATTYEIEVVGLEGSVNECVNQLKSKHEEIKKRLNRTSHVFEKTKLEVELLKKIKVFEKLQDEIEDLTVNYGTDSITVEAQQEDVKSVQLRVVEISSYIKNKHWKHGWSKYCEEFVQNRLRPKISKMFEEKRIIVVWEVRDDMFEFHVYDNSDSYAADSDNEADDICELIINTMKNVIVENIARCERNSVDILESTEWTSFVETITEMYETSAEHEVVVNKVYVYGLSAEANELKKKVVQFIEEHSVMSSRIESNDIELKFMKKHMPNFLRDLEHKHASKKMNLSSRGDKVAVRATKAGLKIAELEMNKFSKSMVCEPYVIERVAVKEVMRDEYDQGTLDKIETDTRCIIQLPGEEKAEDTYYHVSSDDLDSTVDATARRPQGSSQPTHVKKSNVFKATNGITVQLVKGELHTQDGDVMVVTTAPNLNLSSGNACKSILRAGGQEIQDECKQKYPDGIKFGELAVVHGQGLECNRVYFTTLPNWGKQDEDPKQMLKKVIIDSMVLAAKHNKYSILFSAMGTGQLRYPVDIVAREMYESVIEFDKDNAGSSLKDVKFVLYQKDIPTIKAFEAEAEFRVSGDGNRPTHEYQTGPIKVQVVVENIAEQKVDAIFCTTSKTMDLRHGACQAILRSGGKSLEEECESKYGKQLDDGQIAEIGAGNLSCKCLLLTVLPGYRQDALDELQKVMSTMLNLCEAKKVTSIAMPALGTGNLRYPKQAVCNTMFEAIIDWAKTNPTTCLKNVRFVMHAKDHEVVQTFQSYVRTAQGRGHRKGRDQSQGFSMPSTLGATGGQPKASRCNATKDTFTIGKVSFHATLGDLLKEKSDVIVNSVNQDLALIGGVAQALVKQCPSVGEECKKPDIISKLQQKNIVRTACKGLNAKWIFHLQHTEKLNEWTGRIRLCLDKANRHKFKSISFPVLGTGQGFISFSPEDIASCMFDAIDEFESSITGHINLRTIRLIVFSRQPQMLDMVLKTMHRKIQAAAAPQTDSTVWSMLTKGVQKGKNLFQKMLNTDMKPEERDKLKKETSSMTIQIYSDDKQNIEKCKIELNAKLEKKYDKKKIDDYVELIKVLQPEEIAMLDVVALVNINIDATTGVITLYGPTKQVHEVCHEIKLKLLKIERNRNEIKNAEELFKIVQWQYEEMLDTGDVKQNAYNKELNFKIEEAYKANKPNIKFLADGNTYVIDFQQLVEYDEKDDKDTVRVIRKDILKEAKASLPADWTKMNDDQNLMVVPLAPTDAKYKTIEQKFINEVKTGNYSQRVKFSFDVSKLKVLKIERVQNKTLYQQYHAKKKYMTEQKPNLPPNMPIERELWHGMKPEVIASIQNHGFNRSYSGDANGQPWYGDGVYFAGDASYSCRGWLTGAKPGQKSHIFLVNTLTGQYCKGTQGMRYLPPVDPNKPTVMFDSAVNDPAKPYEFVIFNDTQAYPGYLLTFTS